MPKITALPIMATPDDADEIAIVDESDTTTKRLSAIALAGYVSENLTVGSVFKPNEIAIWNAQSTSDQTTGTSASEIIIDFGASNEYKSATNFDTSTSKWTAPANGWVEMFCTVSVTGGDGSDDTNTFGFGKNGSSLEFFLTNWRWFSRGGIEYLDTVHTAVQVSEGDELYCFFGDIGGISLTLKSTYCHFSGRFTPDYS